MNAPSANLIQKVQTLNAFNLLVNSLLPRVNKLVKDFEGKKIKAVSSGDFTAGFSSQVENAGLNIYQSDSGITHYFSISYTSLYFKVYIRVDGRERLEDSVYLGDVDKNGVLHRYSFELEKALRKTDFDAQKIYEQNVKVKELEKQLSEEKSKVYHAFQNDF